MTAKRETPSTDSEPKPSPPPSESPSSENGTDAPINLKPGPEETVFKGSYPGRRDSERV